jgi:hypothetical protein
MPAGRPYPIPDPEPPRQYVRRVIGSLACLVLLTTCLLGMLAVASGCRAVAPTYDGQVISATERLASDADALLKDAREPFDRHALEVAAMRVRLVKLRDVATARGKGNLGVVSQWEMIAQPRAKGGNLLGAVLDDWERDATLAEPLLGHQRMIIREAFRAVLSTEFDRPPGLQERMAMEMVLGSDSSAAEADLFPGSKGDPLPEGHLAQP